MRINGTWNGTEGEFNHAYYGGCLPQQDNVDLAETYILPSMIAVGAIGNVFTLILFCRGKQKRLSVSVYMSAYCIGNLSNLFFIYGMHLITVAGGLPELSNLSSWGCSLSMFATQIIQYCSVWFVVGMTIDRYIAACHPSSAVSMCTVFMAKVAIGIILIGLVVVSVHAMWIYDLDKCGVCRLNNDVENLNMKEENHLHLQIWILQSAIAYAYLPLLILLVLNILLIFGLCFQHSSSSTSAQDNVSTEYTNTVVAISVTHFTLLLPSTIVNIVFVSGAEVTLSHQTGLTFDYMQRINLINTFLICVIFSRSFRQEIRNVCRQLRERKKHTVEMNRLSNKSLIPHDGGNTTANEEDTLI